MCVSVVSNLCKRADFWFLIAVLCCVNAYSLFTLTTKPAYWYDEALNVELARNLADFGKLDLIVAPGVFSGKGALVGSTGYPITAPLAGFFKLFGFGLAQVRMYMLLWMSACLVVFFFVAKKLWGSLVAYGGTALIATFAPFYGNGRSVMGEIPGFLFFLLSLYFLERKKWCLSGILLGASVVSKPSVFLFLIPAYALVLFCRDDVWRNKLVAFLRLGTGSLCALLPWFAIYAGEFALGGLIASIIEHFKNPYAEAGIGVTQNIVNNLPTLLTSTTLLYMWVMLVGVLAALFLERTLFRTHQTLCILAAVYLPLALLQYLKSFGYLRYLIAVEFLVFILFLLALPVLARRVFGNSPLIKGSTRQTFSEKSGGEGFKSSVPHFSEKAGDTSFKKGGIITGSILVAMSIVQLVHLFWFSDLYSSEKAQKTLSYLSVAYPQAIIGVMNVPQVGSLLAPDRKYQYLSTYGLWQFGVNPLLLPLEQMPAVIVADSDDPPLSSRYEKDAAFRKGFTVYTLKR